MAILMVAGLAGSSPALGDEDTDTESRLQALTVQLKEQDVADKGNAATAELGKGEALRDQARSLSDKRSDREELARTLDELEATLALIGAKIVHANAKAALDAQKAKMKAVEATLAKTKASADAIEKQQAELSAKLGGGQ